MKKLDKQGFALLEAVIIIMIFTMLASVLYGQASAKYRLAMGNICEEEAYYAAVSAVRLMSGEVRSGEGTAAHVLIAGDGMEKRKTVLTFEPEEESGEDHKSKETTIPVTVWSERDGDRLLLAAEAESGGRSKLVTLKLEKRVIPSEDGPESEWNEATASDAESAEEMIWVPVAYQIESR